MIEHPFEPIYSVNSNILILGSFPSVKSRDENFYYAHPQNRFWKLIAKIYNENVPVTIDEKKNIILRNNLAIWDVIKRCDIVGSADNTIQNVEINDINKLVCESNIKKIVFNGKKAFETYIKYNKKIENIEYVELPSTSPANAQYSLDRLYNVWYGTFK